MFLLALATRKRRYMPRAVARLNNSLKLSFRIPLGPPCSTPVPNEDEWRRVKPNSRDLSQAGLGFQASHTSIAARSVIDATLLSNSAPLFIPFVAWLWLHKPVSRTVAVSLLIGLAGVVLTIHPGPELLHDPAATLALASGVLSAIALVATNRLAETDPPSRTLLWNFGVSAVLLIPIAIAVWKPLSPRIWMILLSVGALYALTQWFIVLAYRYADAAELSPFNYSVVVFTVKPAAYHLRGLSQGGSSADSSKSQTERFSSRL